jgi:acyl-CoA synthetase (AMP-forming)/AMP-acid ligase II
MTWCELDQRSRAIGATLSSHVRSGDRVLVVYPPGLEFLPAFFGCLYARAIAVPVQVPRQGRQTTAADRFQAILADAHPSAVLTQESLLTLIDELCRNGQRHGRLSPSPIVLATDRISTAEGLDPLLPLREEATAFLQYTSGSTAMPRGVRVSHDNILHNLEAAVAVGTPGHVEASVSWLPATHDMGLIEGLLQPVWRGQHAVVLPPASFLQRPIRWLRAISRYRAFRSGGPNFAYDLCARRITDDDLVGLDLSCWRDAYNGAEPVRNETLAAFAGRFASVGFTREAFRPCYGLAEATLLVACGRWNGLEEGGASCGTPAPETEIAIVDPDTRRRCTLGETGEIWIAGPGVASGYWGPDAVSAGVFGARLESDARSYLRTGDLGRLDADGLHVTGRLKDVLIVRGQKHFPVDLEITAANAHPAAMPFGVAAFAADTDVEGDRIVIAVEVDRRWTGGGTPAGAVVDAVRGAVVDAHGIRVEDVVLLRPRTLPRTTSGKVQRYLCRDRWRQGRLLLAETTSVQ